MPLEKQVVGLELAKKLKELGVPQESIFYWNEKAGIADFYNHFMPTDREIAAFTVAELGEMLPMLSSPLSSSCDFSRNSGKWQGIHFPECHMVFAYTEADARAALLIYLIENGLYDPQK
jgi:hypothetical protein